jgi:hypothetical protein
MVWMGLDGDLGAVFGLGVLDEREEEDRRTVRIEQSCVHSLISS